MDFKKYIPEIEKKIRYKFKDKSLLEQAFTRTSFCNEKNYGGRGDYVSNEVLEFFGDSVLSTAIISLLLKSKTKRYHHGITTELCEGDFSNIRSKLSDKTNLSRTTAALGLQKYLQMGEGDSKLGIENEPSVMEDLFESLMGAIYIDCDMNIGTVIEVVSGILDVAQYAEASVTIQSYKNALQEWCADKKRRLPAPVYKTVSESGPDHKKTYERACYIGDRLYGIGKGKNQKLADTAAAEATLKMLMQEDKKASPTALEALAKLKAMASSEKIAGPEFRDMGETSNSTEQAREFAVECRFAGKSACGKGPSKQDARAVAAERVLDSIRAERAAKKVTPATVQAKPKAKKAKAKELQKSPISKVKPQKGATLSDRAKKPKKAPIRHKKTVG